MAKLQAAKDSKTAKAEGKKDDGKKEESKDAKHSKQPEAKDTPVEESKGEKKTEDSKPAEEKKPKQKQQQAPPKAAKAAEPTVSDIGQMDIRVGKIVKVWKHPDSEKLYCEEIDVGNGEIRKIASGL